MSPSWNDRCRWVKNVKRLIRAHGLKRHTDDILLIMFFYKIIMCRSYGALFFYLYLFLLMYHRSAVQTVWRSMTHMCGLTRFMIISKKPQPVYNIQNKIYICKTIYSITKTEIEKPINRSKGILFIFFPTNKIRGLLLCLLIDFLQMITIYFNIKLIFIVLPFKYLPAGRYVDFLCQNISNLFYIFHCGVAALCVGM